jgi:hypothetical protein
MPGQVVGGSTVESDHEDVGVAVVEVPVSVDVGREGDKVTRDVAGLQRRPLRLGTGGA